MTHTVVASRAGAHLDTDLMEGGGNDDTPVLQSVLNDAAHGQPVHLIVDGPALVTGLDVYSNTVIECTPGAGLYLKSNSSRAIIRNAHRSREAVVDEHIEIRGCFLNGNREGQPTSRHWAHVPQWPYPTNQENDGTFMSGLQFLGVNYLTVDDVTLWSIRAFGALIANASYVEIHKVTVDDGGGPDQDPSKYFITDGFHFKGPLRFVSIDSVKFRVGDDAIGISPNDFETDDITTRNDFGPYVGQGSITDVVVSNVVFEPGQYSGIRIFSANERVDRITLHNIRGTVKDAFFVISHWVNPKSFGNVGAITVEDVSVDRQPMHVDPDHWVESDDAAVAGGADGWHSPLIFINDRVEFLSVRQLVANITDNRSIMQIGPDGDIRMMDIDMFALDPRLEGQMIEFGDRGHIGRLKFALSWFGDAGDQGKNPIVSAGGTITDLSWSGTPPMFVRAYAVGRDPFSVDVTFSQKLKNTVSAKGARIALGSGRVLPILSTTLRPDGMTIRYELGGTVGANGCVSWAYDGDVGALQNLDGTYLHSVSAKVVGPRAKCR